ncbi:sporulation protein YunB [Petroclostridium xylanilyticum]|uniref:sporulation protein YunB n=1 Tax=Petroclostridium xylanilyticum TaxID=1792311 RepID=UPI000B98EA0B|nr:sporulation protein YunB [Petroclostridium xylanilyticum]
MRFWTRGGLRYRPKYRKMNRRNYNIYLVIAVIFLLVFYSLSLFDKKIRPTITSIAEARAKYIATRAINEAVNEKIAESNLKYEDLITFQKNNDGQITALQANIVKMNQLKAALSMSVQQKIVNIDSTQINVPIGNVINSQILSGWGPRIPVRLIPVGTAQIDFKSNFSTAGINQTKHEIFLEVHSTVAVLLPMVKTSSEVVTTVPVAETIIVGTVPQQYINVEGATSNAPDTILNMLN